MHDARQSVAVGRAYGGCAGSQEVGRARECWVGPEERGQGHRSEGRARGCWAGPEERGQGQPPDPRRSLLLLCRPGMRNAQGLNIPVHMSVVSEDRGSPSLHSSLPWSRCSLASVRVAEHAFPFSPVLRPFWYALFIVQIRITIISRHPWRHFIYDPTWQHRCYFGRYD